MANISEAYGKIFVKADSKKALEELKKVIKWHDDLSKRGDYFTEITSEGGLDKARIFEFFDSPYCGFEVNFSGYGRWSYHTNVEAFLNWPYYDEENHDIDFDLLKKSNFSLTFIFRDEECGNDFLYEAELVLDHKKNVEIDNTKCIEEKYKGYKRTWVNLLKFGYSLKGLIELYLYDQENFDLYETLKREKAPLEEYLNKPLKEIIGEEYYNAYLEGEKEYKEREEENS